MDRRSFLGGIGTLGVVGVATTGALRARSSSDVTPAARAASTSATAATARSAGQGQAQAMTLGYLQGGDALLASGGSQHSLSAVPMRWETWSGLPSQSAPVKRTPSTGIDLIDITIGFSGSYDRSATTLRGLDITAHYAIDEAPYFVPVKALRLDPSKLYQTESRMARFTAVPEGVALEVGYTLAQSAVAGGVANSGGMYLPIGADARASNGLPIGVYVIAGPSAATGQSPDFNAFMYSGDLHTPISDPTGRRIDFDYLTLTISAADA